MPARARTSMLAFVTPRTTSLTLRCRVDGDEIAGEVTDGQSPTRDFRGWLGLIAAIDELLAAPGAEEPAGKI